MHAKDSKLLLPKSDFVFGLLFGNPNYTDLLVSLLQAILGFPMQDFLGIKILNPITRPKYPTNKTCILDVKIMLKNKKMINVEIQIKNLPGLRERILFYTASMITNQIKKGEDYQKIQQVIGIYILDYELLPGKKFHHTYNLIEKQNGDILTDLLEIHIIELPKVKNNCDNMLCNWMQFIHADTEEKMALVAKRSPKIRKAYARIVELSADAEAQMIEEAIEKARRDEASRMQGALAEGIAIGKKQAAKIIEAKDAALSEQAAALSEQAAALSQKDARIAELEAQLGKA
ncbi:MAG: hypothetical protein Ta2G_04580 [Termitinemataceae bacterium]|nr:MAG: hypothetical protein Ta2G_04580 [Termitinemataceae bacterium]